MIMPRLVTLLTLLPDENTVFKYVLCLIISYIIDNGIKYTFKINKNIKSINN